MFSITTLKWDAAWIFDGGDCFYILWNRFLRCVLRIGVVKDLWWLFSVWKAKNCLWLILTCFLNILLGYTNHIGSIYSNHNDINIKV